MKNVAWKEEAQLLVNVTAKAGRMGAIATIALVASILSFCSPVSGTTITDLGTLGGNWSDASAVNDSGLVTGLMSENDDGHVYTYQNGKFIDLFPILDGLTGEPTGLNQNGVIASATNVNGFFFPTTYDASTGARTVISGLGGQSGNLVGFATAVNNFGQAVGYAYVPSGEWHPFFYSAGLTTDLGCLPGEDVPCYGYALGINDTGEIVGGTGKEHAFRWKEGEMKRLDPDGMTGRAYAVNSQGQITGYVCDATYCYGFISDGEDITIIETPPSFYTAGFAINEAGTIAGAVWLKNNKLCRNCYPDPHAFVKANGGPFIDLNTLLSANSGWILSWAFGLNNKGQVVGTGIVNGSYHAFLMQL